VVLPKTANSLYVDGSETIDDDVVMKARGIALNRGIEIE